jgi:hypothetical protein
MAHRLLRRQALLGKIEAIYGTDPVPAGATDAMVIYDLNITPLDLARADRMPVRPFFGQDNPIVGGSPVKVEFSVPIAGGGAAGTAPGYDCVLRAAARSKTVNAGVSVVYAPISGGFESATFYAWKDAVQHKVTGFRGNASVEFNHKGIPIYKVSGQGIYNAPTDVALPTLTIGGTWPNPLLVNKVNTTFSIHGYTARLLKFAYDPGVQINWKDNPNNTEEVRVTDRPKVAATATVEADTIATKDWQAIAKAATTGAIALVHGTTAGNKWQFDAARAQVLGVKYGDDDGILNYELALELLPSSAGNNEFSETVL